MNAVDFISFLHCGTGLFRALIAAVSPDRVDGELILRDDDVVNHIVDVGILHFWASLCSLGRVMRCTEKGYALVSIKDVARAAGVSDKTVSRVVNNEPNVTPETTERVRAAIERLNYVPNLSARMIRTNQSRTFGIMTDYISTSPYSGEIVRGIHQWARANGRTIFLANTDGDPEQEQAAWRTFQEHRIDGVLYVTMYQRVLEIAAADLPIPTVLVNCRSLNGDTIPSVVPDDYAGCRRLVEHVLSLGHRRIAYIRLNPVLHGGEERLRAFRESVAAADTSDLIDDLVGMTGPVGKEENFTFVLRLSCSAGPNRRPRYFAETTRSH